MSFFPWNKKDKKAKEKKSNNAEATSPASGSSNDIGKLFVYLFVSEVGTKQYHMIGRPVELSH